MVAAWFAKWPQVSFVTAPANAAVPSMPATGSLPRSQLGVAGRAKWKQNHQQSTGVVCVVAALQGSCLFLREVSRLFDLCTSLQSILCGRHRVKSERKQGATLDSIQLFTPSGSFRSLHKTNIFESTSRQHSFFGLYKVSI